mmetsp:Transcript_37749/g.84142  ORF Transcript_37749/g.84142 Transcript_37749/m.84142 type:complete len:348 (-) Transcript_37749:1231-2274(-)
MTMVDDNPRTAHWRETPSWSSNPLSPTKKEALRSQLLGKQYGVASRSTERLTMYMDKTQHAPAGSPFGRRTGRFNTADLGKDPRVQEWLSPTGEKQHLDTQVPDRGPFNNVNMIRWQRTQEYTNPLPQDGGRTYSPTVCLDNWVEERTMDKYGSGFHVKELGFQKLYESEYNSNYSPPTQEYYGKVLHTHILAQYPDPDVNVKPKDADGATLYYSHRGFGEEAKRDHTAEPKRGASWVGTAPIKPWESVSSTVRRQAPLEFQARSSATDPRSKILSGMHLPLDMTNPMHQSTMRSLGQSQRHTANWKTSYSIDFKDMSRRAMTPGPQRGPPLFPQTQSLRPATAAVV